MTTGLQALVGFGRSLRARGLPVGTGRILAFYRAVGALAPLDRDKLYWAGRTTLISRKEDVAAFDSAFHAFFADRANQDLVSALFEEGLEAAKPSLSIEGLVLEEPIAGSLEESAEDTAQDAIVTTTASAVEVLKTKSFDELSASERAQAAALIRRLGLTLPLRSSRRLRPSAKGRRFDLRRTLRSSLKTQGEPFRRSWRATATRARPLVLILDVSGSMSPYSRALLQFGHAAMRAGQRVDVFCFGTRLSRVSAALRKSDPNAALEDVAATVHDWEGGTRIGDSIKELLDRYAQTSSLRGAVVVLCSDGLDRGDPQMLAAQMAKLGRLSHKLVWANPLKGSPRYEPLARGMAASLPFVDVFLSGHNLESLEELAEVVARGAVPSVA